MRSFDDTSRSRRAILLTRRRPRSRRRPRGRRPLTGVQEARHTSGLRALLGQIALPHGASPKGSTRLRAASGRQLYPSAGLRHSMHPATARSGLGQWRSRGPQDPYPDSGVTNKRCTCAVFDPPRRALPRRRVSGSPTAAGILVGAAGFEPTIPAPQTQCDTRLRHAPMRDLESTATPSPADPSRPAIGLVNECPERGCSAHRVESARFVRPADCCSTCAVA
jgi:hypothetical protein